MLFWKLLFLWLAVLLQSAKANTVNSLVSAQCKVGCFIQTLDQEIDAPGQTSEAELPLEKCLKNPGCASCELPCGYPLTSFAACSSLCQDDVQLCQRSCRFLETVHITKAGVCPDPKDAVGIYGRCVTGCEVDGDCTGHLKCCRNTCGVTCQPPLINKAVLPPIPSTPIIVENEHQPRSIDLQWHMNENFSAPVLFVVEGRWHAGSLFTNTFTTEWTQLSMVSKTSANIAELDVNRWYVFRVASVSVNGSLGFSDTTAPYRIQREVRAPSSPRNLTKIRISIHDSLVDATIQWLEPTEYDLPIGKYKITWDKRVEATNTNMNYVDQYKKMVPGEMTSYTLKNLDAESTYYVQVQAISYNGKDRLKSESTSMYIVTPVLATHNAHFDTDARDRVVQKPTPGPPRNVTIGQPYYHNGLVKATVYWKTGRGVQGAAVDKLALHWTPEACIAEDGTEKTHSRSMHGWATVQDRRYDLYDLLFDCRYTVRMEPVSHLGVKGRQIILRFNTPSCADTTVVGEVEPDCPTDAPNVPHQPPHVQETIYIRGRNITATITWKEPFSDRPISGYRVIWGIRIHEPEGFPSYALRDQQPIDKNTALTKVLPKDQFSLNIPNLDQLTTYIVNVQALSEIGSGYVSQTAFETPQLPSEDAAYRHYERSESMYAGASSALTPSYVANVKLLLLIVFVVTVVTSS